MAKINKITFILVAILATFGILAVSFTMTPVLATNATNITEQIQINCTTWIDVEDASIDALSGAVQQDSTSAVVYTNNTTNVNWTGQPNILDYIRIENRGNNNITLNITLIDHDGFLTTVGNSISVRANDTNVYKYGSDDNYTSCNSGLQTSWATLTLNVSTTLCTSMSWLAASDELAVFDRFIISSNTPPGTYNLTKRISAYEYACEVPEGYYILTHGVSATDGTVFEIDAVGNVMDSWNMPALFGSHGVTGTYFIDLANNGANNVVGITDQNEIVLFDMTPVGATFISRNVITVGGPPPAGLFAGVAWDPVIAGWGTTEVLAIWNNGPNANVYIVNIATGAATLLSTIVGVNDISGAAPAFNGTYVYASRSVAGTMSRLSFTAGTLSSPVSLTSGATATPYYGSSWSPGTLMWDEVDNTPNGVLTLHSTVTGVDVDLTRFTGKTPRGSTSF